MKNLLPILIILFSVFLSNTFCYGQNIDSIYTIPEKLVIDEETSLVIQFTLPHGRGGTISKNHNWKEDTLFIEVCYVSGPLAAVQTHTDTFVLGKMNFNKFVVQVTANISKKYDTCIVFKSQSKVKHLPPIPLDNKNLLNGLNFQIYPNPFSQQFTLDMEGFQEKTIKMTITKANCLTRQTRIL